MKRYIVACIFLTAIASVSFAQDAQKVLDTFRRNFAIASLDVKIQILQDAAAGKTASAMGPLYQQAVDFVTDNASLIPTDARFNQLAAIAAEQIGVGRRITAAQGLRLEAVHGHHGFRRPWPRRPGRSGWWAPGTRTR